MDIDQYTPEINRHHASTEECTDTSGQTRVKRFMEDERTKYGCLHNDVFNCPPEAFKQKHATHESWNASSGHMTDLYSRTHLIIKHHTRLKVLL